MPVTKTWRVTFPEPTDCETLFIRKGRGYVVPKLLKPQQPILYCFPLDGGGGGAEEPEKLTPVGPLPVRTPVTYSASKTTTYVDEAGAPVSVETVRSGVPVTVHYVKEGDRMIANRVIVHKKVTSVAPTAVEESRTTTTTTTKKED